LVKSDAIFLPQNPEAKTFLEKRGDPNGYDAGTGWTPMLMAVSGDLEAGGLSLLTWVKPSGMGKSTLLK